MVKQKIWFDYLHGGLVGRLLHGFQAHMAALMPTRKTFILWAH